MAEKYFLSKQRIMEIVKKPFDHELKSITASVLRGEPSPSFYDIYGRKKNKIR